VGRALSAKPLVDVEEVSCALGRSEGTDEKKGYGNCNRSFHGYSLGAVGVILSAEEDGRCEDSLKALNNSSIMATIGSEAEEIEHLKGSFNARKGYLSY
jgi:hypothetical protein